jgi:hypothetical protein
MADLLVERLTGQQSAPAVPVEVHVVMTDTGLFGGPVPAGASVPADRGGRRRSATRATDLDPTAAPAWLVGSGPIPAAAARALLDPALDGAEGRARVWLRRLYTHPDSGQLVAMDSRRRLFDGLLRRMLVLRDDTCRTPWCDAPIRHADHGAPHHDGGATAYTNGSGLCERCNQTKEAALWRHRASPDRLDVVTPTGHVYRAPTRPLIGIPTGGCRQWRSEKRRRPITRRRSRRRRATRRRR